MVTVVWAAADVPVVSEDDLPRAGSYARTTNFNPPKSWYKKKREHFDLDEKIVVHTDSSEASDLIDWLVPPTWRVHYDTGDVQMNRRIVFHAETTRKRALGKLCASLGLKGIFYPRRRLILIVDGARP